MASANLQQKLLISKYFLRTKKVYGLKITQSGIYVKEYFYMFFSTLKDIIQAQYKISH